MKRALILAALLAAGCGRAGGAPFPSSSAVYQEMIAIADTDRDGRVSRVEWKAARADDVLFVRGDRDGSGDLDVEEVTAMFVGINPRERFTP